VIRAEERKLLPRPGVAGPMPWIIAVILLIAVLTASAALGLSRLADRLGFGTGISVEIVTADPARREADAITALRLIGTVPGITNVRRVPDAEVAAAVEPWLGDVRSAGIPLPALIEADLEAGGAADLKRALAAKLPSARLSTSAEWLAPLARLVGALRWLAAGLLLLMAAATAAVVTLAARAAFDSHRETIELLHLIGAEDDQVSRLVQRRIAADALWGSLIGAGAAFLLLFLIGSRIAALGSGLLGVTAGRGGSDWPLLLLLPAGAALLAMLVARAAVLRALKRLL
jgi:cell division transport system permease protein